MTQPLSGFRLARLELYNWGTFDQHVWTLHANARTTLLTGDIGSGKSTIVDAVTTLLLPANRISYNKAAGAETRERTLRSYVLGFYKSERNEVTGTTKPVGLRDGTNFSVILGVFRNEGYDATVTLAQVFWMRNADAAGQPDRFYVTADRPLSVAGDFDDFGTDITLLRKRLRAGSAIRLHDGFPEYGKDFRRRLGIESEQAMELFHQTVSMKSVGNLTDFVRDHMLEPFDAAKATANIVAHFEDLTKAHEAVQRAQSQLAALTPLLKDCDAFDAVNDEIKALNAQREALKYYFADAKAGLLDELLKNLSSERMGLTVQREGLDEQLKGLRERETQLRVERAGHGGNRLAEIERQIGDGEKTRAARMTRAQRFGNLLVEAGLDPVQSVAQFAARRSEIAVAHERASQAADDCQTRLKEVAGDERTLREESGKVNAELRSLRERKNNIPKRNLDIRRLLCQELELAESALPFAGELITVLEHESDWEGAAERLLHSFALSILVPDDHYAPVADWINDHFLNGRVVYYRVPAMAPGSGGTGSRDARRSRPPARSAARNPLSAKLDVRDTPFASWVEDELATRADYECVAAMEEFRRTPRAVTRAGQIKGAGGRHEKDDRFRIDDRSTYVLGWTNERKIDALLRQAAALQGKLSALTDAEGRLKGELDAAIKRGQVLAGLDQTSEFAEIDWQSTVNRIAELKDEHAKLKAASAELARLDADLTTVTDAIANVERIKSAADGRLGAVENRIADADARLGEARQVLAGPGCQEARKRFKAVSDLLGKAGHEVPGTAGACDKAETAAAVVIVDITEKRAERKARLSSRIVNAMGEFRRQYPVETSELDNAVESATGYRELHKQLTDDDLPRFQQQFKTYLNQNTIRDIAGFQSQLNKQADVIRERIDTINSSLVDVDYNPGRYIELQRQDTPHQEVRDFRADLRACTDGAVSAGAGDGDDQYSEQKFLQVSRIIERFRGREGQTEADKRWTRFVTDVRNWFLFSASERYREDDTEYEHYADSAGKSGGQKEKLAYTILAASLAYQFKLEWGAAKSRTFQFAVIDEAFGRGSDESTRFALELFERLGLQLLIVTPLQKIHVIEPYVNAVGFVDNPMSSSSRLQTLTIEEYRARREAHMLAGAAVSPVPVPVPIAVT
ncbi:MAG: hypothetical protein JWO75_2813 [Actinomycetia bacterium]|nr:hypothetical protein [Actinomycetes bacterium]